MIESVKKLVREASEEMLTDTFEIAHKEGFANIVTTSDLAVQNFLKKGLSILLPGSGFLCEEEDRHLLGKEYTWIIDPIDGTANYSRGIDQCAVCVGLKHHEEMELAVVYLPRTEELFSAVKGQGAFLNDKPISVSTISDVSELLHRNSAIWQWDARSYTSSTCFRPGTMPLPL